MKTVAQESNDNDNDFSIDLEMRQRARKVIAQVFPDAVADFRLIEQVTREIVVTDEDGIVEEATKKETANLGAARAWAKDAYGDDSPAATLTAYEVLYGMSIEDRWFEINDKLDELTTPVEKKRK